MNDEPAISPQTVTGTKRRRLRKRVVVVVILFLLGYLTTAYLILPIVWKYYAHRYPSLEGIPNITYTANGIPGDPLNVALIGSEPELKKIMLAAKWFPADPITFRSCLKIATDVVLKKPDQDAPVSSLYLWKRKEDLAFEKPVGGNPRHRHHVRFWRSDRTQEGRLVWVGSATYDQKVGLSHTTGQVTHHILPDIDAERDTLFYDLQQTRKLSGVDIVNGFHKILKGRNGGGDPWYTDGNLWLGTISPEN